MIMIKNSEYLMRERKARFFLLALVFFVITNIKIDANDKFAINKHNGLLLNRLPP